MASSASNHNEPELPDSPSEAFLSNISSPVDEDGDVQMQDSNNTSMVQNNDTLTASQLSEISQRCRQRRNGRVQEYSQDGKVKLKISLKGMSNNGNDTTGVNNDSATSNENSQLGLNPTQHTQISQKVFPPDSAHSTNTTDGDDFSDDINFSQLESNSVQILDLSPYITVMKRPKCFNVKVKLTPQMKMQLQNDAIEKRQKMLRDIEVKRQQAKLKFAAKQKEKAEALAKKAKLKPKKRAKPLYSRYMVNMACIMPFPNRDEIYVRNMMKMKTDAQGTTIETDDDDGLVEQSVRLSLKDPLSGSRMVTPLRSIYCSHVECFDYDAFLAMNNLKPFKIAIQRYSDKPSIVGDVDVLRLLEDTKRMVMNAKVHNKVTTSFPYKTKMKTLKEKGKQLNELEWFTCPICKIEFNIKVLGDVYVVGEFVDLLQDLSLEANNENVEDIEIDMASKGKWRWIRDDENDEKFGNHTHSNRNTGTPDTVLLQHAINDGSVIRSSPVITDPAQTANDNIHIEMHNNVEVVTLDSDDETPGEIPSASENIVNALVPLIQADNPDATEEEMMRQIDALFDGDLMGVGDDTAASTPSSSVPPATTKMRELVRGNKAAHPPPNYRPRCNVPCTNPNHNHTASYNESGFYQASKHAGVVQFRPAGPPSATFVHQHPPEPAPVFMNGEGAADDPIVLD